MRGMGINLEVVHLKWRLNKDPAKRRAGTAEVLSLYTQAIWSNAHQCYTANAHLPHDDTLDLFETIPGLQKQAYDRLHKRGIVRR